ncbi:MAG: pirin-like C-terminal cupin domain-containing protein, partial [Spirochaetota bacterium]
PDSWASDSQSQVAIWLIELQAAADWTLPAVEAGLNRTLYYYQGEGLEIAGSKIPSYHGVELMSDRNIPLKNASGIARLVLLQGRPLQEPVVQYGPFVMNTEQEIRQTFVDYQNTQFGGWPWPSSEHTHGKEPGRFAKHADGSQEQK